MRENQGGTKKDVSVGMCTFWRSACNLLIHVGHSGRPRHPLFVPLLPWVAIVAKVLVLQMLWSVIKLPTYLCFL